MFNGSTMFVKKGVYGKQLSVPVRYSYKEQKILNTGSVWHHTPDNEDFINGDLELMSEDNEKIICYNNINKQTEIYMKTKGD